MSFDKNPPPIARVKPESVFRGSRHARIRDPFGHIWAFNAPQAKKD